MKNNYNFESVPSNNHGCRGSWIVVRARPTDLTGIVVEGGSCSSCWQVGHDRNESPIAIGTRVSRPSIGWEAGARCIGNSHNELVTDEDASDTSAEWPQVLK